MIALWLAAAAAAETDDPTDRLLGSALVPTATAPIERVDGWTDLWPVAVVGLGLAALVWQHRRGRPVGPASETLVVVGRSTLGGSATLFVVDVREISGRSRRLVVATGAGPTALLAELDGGEELELASAGAPPGTGRGVDRYAPPERVRKAAALSLIDEVVGARRSAGSA